MIKGLKVVMIIWAAYSILVGLAFICIPEQLGAMSGFEKGPESFLYLLALLGIGMIVPNAFLIVAARDPLKNIIWVQFALAMAVLVTAVEAYSIGRGFVTFQQVGMGLIITAVFAVAFLALYPYRAARIAARRRK